MSRLRSAWGWSRGGKRRPVRTRDSAFRFRPTVELLAERVLPAVSANFANGVLTVIGDESDNSLAISRDGAGMLVVNGDGVVIPIQGGPATVGNTTLIRLFGMGGNDELIWSRSANLPRALVDGGAGNDTITSGTGDDTLVGGAGNDIYRIDTDTPLGGDTIDESGGGIDTLDFSSTNTRAVNINLGNPAAQVINAGLTLTLSAGNTIENVIGGDLADTLTGNGLNNVILGGSGNDTLIGAGGDDVIAGGVDNDTVVGNGGKDTFFWNPGDGNDLIDGVTNDGIAGSDHLVFNGSNVAEKFAISADGFPNVVTRDVDNVRLDLVGVEIVTVNALGGADTVTVNDLTGTGVTQINLDLARVAGGATGDGETDAVIVNGRNAADFIPILGSFIGANTGAILVNGNFANGTGLPYFMAMRATEVNDTLTVNALGGDDTVDASGVFATNGAQIIRLIVNGGAGNDTLIGSPGADIFVWNPGDGSDTIDAGDGGGAVGDALIFNGSDLAERFDVSANGTRVRLTRDLGGVVMDLNGVEEIDLDTLGGADTVTINDQSTTGTNLRSMMLNLSGTIGGTAGDGAADSVILNGSDRGENVIVTGTGSPPLILVAGLSPFLSISGMDGPTDHLTVNTLGGNDGVNSTALAPGLIGLTVDLGDGQLPPPKLSGVVVNGGAGQRSQVTQLRIAFDQRVGFFPNPSSVFRLVRQSDGAAVLLRAVVDDTGPATVVTLTFIGGAVEGASLADGRYTLTILSGDVGGATAVLDGDGDGQAGGDFVLAGDPATNKLFRLFGDVNGDAAVNGLDLTAFRNTFGTTVGSPSFLVFLDNNGDGAINGLDLTAFRANFGKVA